MRFMTYDLPCHVRVQRGSNKGAKRAVKHVVWVIREVEDV